MPQSVEGAEILISIVIPPGSCKFGITTSYKAAATDGNRPVFIDTRIETAGLRVPITTRTQIYA